MKHFFLSFLSLFLAFVFNQFYAVADDYPNDCHVFEVKRLSNWAPEYLTVTNNWCNLFLDSAPSTLKVLSVITEINDKSTAGMEPEDFYQIIDNYNEFSISYQTKIRGQNKSFSCKLIKYDGRMNYDARITRDEWFFSFRDSEGEKSPRESTTIFVDLYTDLFKYNTFDFLLSGDDIGTDYGLIQGFAEELEKKGLVFDPSNPDIHLFLTHQANNRIESIYQPHIVSHSNSSFNQVGNTTFYYGSYASWGRSGAESTLTSTSSVQDVGHAGTFVDSDLFVQVSVLDAKMMDSARPPIVWQMITSKHFVTEVNTLEYAKKLKAAIHFYPSDHMYRLSVRYTGIYVQQEGKTYRVTSVLPNLKWRGEPLSRRFPKGYILKHKKRFGDYWESTIDALGDRYWLPDYKYGAFSYTLFHVQRAAAGISDNHPTFGAVYDAYY